VGRISPEKGMLESLRAFESIAAEFLQAELVLVGYGPDFVALQHAVAASPFAARIRLTGRLSPEEIAQELAQAQVYLQHSREVGGWVEGFGVTLTEAGAAGLPLVASATGGLINQIENGVNGFLFPPGDIAAQAARMRQLAADPTLRARMGADARRLAARFDAAVMAQALEQEILDAISAKRSRQ
jgi:glycosyltransferase involved in cell wall biosynthesis